MSVRLTLHSGPYGGRGVVLERFVERVIHALGFYVEVTPIYNRRGTYEHPTVRLSNMVRSLPHLGRAFGL